MLAFSGIAQIVYLVGLIMAYKHADVGVIYPIARALPVMMVGGSVLHSAMRFHLNSGLVLC